MSETSRASTLGFGVRRLMGRVRMGHEGYWTRTHLVLVVTVDGQEWLADTGFGGHGLREPIPFTEMRPNRTTAA